MNWGPLAGILWWCTELLANVVLRPWLLQQLKKNPKLANDAKRAATATQMLPRVVCFVHNVIQVWCVLINT